MMGEVFLKERQDTVFDSDNLVILIVAVTAFIGQLMAVLIGERILHHIQSVPKKMN